MSKPLSANAQAAIRNTVLLLEGEKDAEDGGNRVARILADEAREGRNQN